MRLKRKESKSFYNKFLKSFALVMLVPTLAMVLIFALAQQVVKEQIVVSNSNTLNQFFSRIDEVVDECWDTSVIIAGDETCMQYIPSVSANNNRVSYLSYKIHNIINEFTKEEHYDAFVYFPSVDRVVSGTFGAGNLDYYYKLNYAPKGIVQEQFHIAVNSPYGKPSIYNMSQDESNPLLTIAMRQISSKNEANHYVVCLVISPGYLQELLTDIAQPVEGALSIILNNQGNVLCSTGDISGGISFDNYNNEGLSFETTANGQKYIMQVKDSDVMDIRYAYGVPYQYFWSRLYHLYIICGVSMVISLVLCLIVVHRQARKNYEPFSKILDRIKNRESVEYNQNEHNELEFFDDMLKRALLERNTLQNIASKGLSAKKDDFIISLLDGRIQTDLGNDNIFEETGLRLMSDYFYVALLKLESVVDMKRDLSVFAVCNVFQELLDRSENGLIVAMTDDQFAILFNPSVKESNELHTLLDEGCIFFSEAFNAVITVGVSSVKEGIYAISDAYREAAHSLKYSYLLGKGIIINYEDIANRDYRLAANSENRMLRKIENVFSGTVQMSDIETVVFQIQNDYKIDSDASLEEVECFKFEMIGALNRLLVQAGYPSSERNEKISHLLHSSLFGDLINAFSAILYEIYLRRQEQGISQDICTKCKEYIEKHYSDNQLSLTYLAEIVGVVPSYLSKLFKERYQISVLDYIAQMRIDHAKKLLRQTRKSVKEIADIVGYVNSNTFIRSFKQLEGMTPGIYREIFTRERD